MGAAWRRFRSVQGYQEDHFEVFPAPRSSSGSRGNLVVPKGTALLRNAFRSRDLGSFLALLASAPNGRGTSPGKGSCLKKVPRAKQRDHFGVMLGPKGTLRKRMAAQGNDSSLERPQKCCFGVTRIRLMKTGYQFALVPHFVLVSSFIGAPPCKGLRCATACNLFLGVSLARRGQ